MNTIKIENLAMDTALDNAAMDSVVGGWGIGKFIKKRVRGASRFINRASRRVRRSARRVIYPRSRDLLKLGLLTVGQPSVLAYARAIS